MITSVTFETLMARVTAGETLSRDEIMAIADAPDLPVIGMLADAARRRLRGTDVSYLRVAWQTCGQPAAAVPAAAREVRMTGAPANLAAAVAAVAAAKSVAGSRGLSGFTWPQIEETARAAGVPMNAALSELRDAGLDALAEFPLDEVPDPVEAIDQLIHSGFNQLCLTVAKASPGSRAELFLRADALQKQFGCIRAIAPLPSAMNALRPTTGYDDVKTVAVARLAASTIPTVQVDWARYGPKLAQVALMFGADDLDAVSADDASPDGRRRAPIEEVRRNITVAGFVPVERDSGFVVVSR